jgi:hypothetical protein
MLVLPYCLTVVTVTGTSVELDQRFTPRQRDRQPVRFLLNFVSQREHVLHRQHQRRLNLLRLDAVLVLELDPTAEVETAGRGDAVEQVTGEIRRFGHGAALAAGCRTSILTNRTPAARAITGSKLIEDVLSEKLGFDRDPDGIGVLLDDLGLALGEPIAKNLGTEPLANLCAERVERR